MKKPLSCLFIIVFTLFLNVSNVFANQIGNEFDKNDFNQSKINDVNPENNKNNKSKASNEDIFGDEQAFPFIAGLGKNAAH